MKLHDRTMTDGRRCIEYEYCILVDFALVDVDVLDLLLLIRRNGFYVNNEMVGFAY